MEILGLNLIKQSFSTWQWIYGKTPSFSLCCPIGDQSSEIKIQVLNGKIERLHFQDITIGKQDALRLNTLLVNQKLDSELHGVISNSSVFGTMGEDRFSKLNEILLTLCLTSVWCICKSCRNISIRLKNINSVNYSEHLSEALPILWLNQWWILNVVIKNLFNSSNQMINCFTNRSPITLGKHLSRYHEKNRKHKWVVWMKLRYIMIYNVL